MCRKNTVTDQPAFTEKTVSAIICGDHVGTVNDLAGPSQDVKDFRKVVEKWWPEFTFREFVDLQATTERFISEVKEAAANVGPEGMLLFIMDICHAESATRNGKFGKHKDLGISKGLGYDKVLVFSSSLSSQTSADAQFTGGPNGAWHFVLEKTLEPGITYLQWFNRAKDLLKKLGFSQIPVIEGPEHLQNRVVFTGDVKVIEVSTHGGQIPDRNGDELDKLDEVIYFRNGYVVDDEIRAIIEAVDKRMKKRLIFERIFNVKQKLQKMTVQNFFKGLFMALMAVVVTFFSQVPVDWATMAITLIATVLVYAGKNAFAGLQSDSPSGSFSWINFVSALLIAIGTGITQAIALIVTTGVIDWLVLGKVVASVTLTYVASTILSPEKSKQRKFVL